MRIGRITYIDARAIENYTPFRFFFCQRTPLAGRSACADDFLPAVWPLHKLDRQNLRQDTDQVAGMAHPVATTYPHGGNGRVQNHQPGRTIALKLNKCIA